jgi:hypothetical protein
MCGGKHCSALIFLFFLPQVFHPVKREQKEKAKKNGVNLDNAKADLINASKQAKHKQTASYLAVTRSNLHREERSDLMTISLV